MRHLLARIIGCFAIIGTIAAFPALVRAQAAASVCKDGTSSAATGRGTCAKHGGVDAAATKSAKMAARAAKRAERAAAMNAKAADKAADKAEKASSGEKDDNDPAGALAQCKDGMYSHSANRRGACGKHGGVKQWLHS